MASTSAFAHHPAADIVDPEIYAMIDENVADTPHADLTFDDMGSRMDQDMDEVGAAMNSDSAPLRDEVAQSDDIEIATDVAMETIDLLENVETAYAR